MGSNPVQAWIFLRPCFHYCLSSVHYCEVTLFTSLSAVQIYDFHIFLAVYLSLHGFIWNQHNDQLPIGLLAHLVERCTGIAEVMGSNSVQAWMFFSGLVFTTAQVVCITARITFIHVFICSSNIWLSYILNRLFHHFTGLFRTNIMTSSQLAC